MNLILYGIVGFAVLLLLAAVAVVGFVVRATL